MPDRAFADVSLVADCRIGSPEGPLEAEQGEKLAYGTPRLQWRDARGVRGYAPRMTVASVQAQESDEGVDLTLIRWMLSLTPAQRVEHIEGIARSLEELRELNRGR